MLIHLRRNAVAYLALLIALSTGTAYAAGLAKNSVGTPQLKKNAVTSPKIKKGAVKKSDIKKGVIPQATWVGAATIFGGEDPAAQPDIPDLQAYEFSVPRAGSLQVVASIAGVSVFCNGGPAFIGAYVDGKPVPGTRHPVTTDSEPAGLAGVIPVTKGDHTVSIGVHCTESSPAAYDVVTHYYSLVLAD